MPSPSIADLHEAALQISGAAASIPLRWFRRDVAVARKADESPVTIADTETEAFLRREIRARFPDHGILGEEEGAENLDRPFVWVVDPIDGTKSFVSGMPLFGMLVGILREGAPQAGIIRMPALGECYSGWRGGPALQDGTPVKCRPTPLAEAIVYINEADRIAAAAPDAFARLREAGRLRRFSYDCYPYALLAAGQIQAVIDFDLKPHDYLPVVPVVEAAGGVMGDWSGRPLGLSSDGRVVAAADAGLFEALVRLLA